MAKQRASMPRGPVSSAKPGKAASYRTPARRNKYLPYLIGGVLLVAVVAAIFLLVNRGTANAGVPGERFPIQGQQHIEQGTTHPVYNSDPPTSGWHYPNALDAGFYEVNQPDELLIHNLEHGHIVISYDCGKLADCDGTKQQIRQLMTAYNNWKITAVPRENEDAALALTAWGWLDKLESFDEVRMRRFIDAFRNRGPEATMN